LQKEAYPIVAYNKYSNKAISHGVAPSVLWAMG